MDQTTVYDELIELRGLRFHYRDWPSTRADAPALVLLHGFSGHARSWDVFADAMTDRYRVLALDQRGHGETAWGAANRYDINEMAADLEAFVQSLELEKFSLLGLSMGGIVSLDYAARHPEALAACVVVDIGPEIATSGLNRIQSSVQSVDIFETKDDAFAAARADNGRPPEAFHRARVDASLMRVEDGSWTYRYDRALRVPGTMRLRGGEPLWRDCARIAAPTLVVRGEVSDILSEETAERMVQTIPDAKLATIASASHAVPFDAPEAFLDTVRDFLTG